jgi:hypothetical protein
MSIPPYIVSNTYINIRSVMNKNFITGLHRLFKVTLLAIVLVVSTISVFFTDSMVYWNDMAFIVWCLCIVTITDYFDKEK